MSKETKTSAAMLRRHHCQVKVVRHAAHEAAGDEAPRLLRAAGPVGQVKHDAQVEQRAFLQGSGAHDDIIFVQTACCVLHSLD